MNQWEIWTWNFPEDKDRPHPTVIVSNPRRIARGFVEVLRCGTHRTQRTPDETEVLLDSADGLTWETLCKCDFIYVAPASELAQRRGLVVLERRRAIIRRIIQSHEWAGL